MPPMSRCNIDTGRRVWAPLPRTGRARPLRTATLPWPSGTGRATSPGPRPSTRPPRPRPSLPGPLDTMELFDAAAVAAALPYAGLVDALEAAFRDGVVAPERTHHTRTGLDEEEATLLLMPAWRREGATGVKVVSVVPGNAARGLGTVHAVYLLLDGETGRPRAVFDGSELTARRTACASALASRLLSRPDAGSLLVAGTGRMAPHLVRAHATVRPLERIRVWGRRPAAAREVVEGLREEAEKGAGLPADMEVAPSLEEAVPAADIVSCATLARTPLVRGRWLRPGQHLDLVGAYTPGMREADAEAVARARVVVDTYPGARAEAGDLLQAVEEGAFRMEEVVADLSELVRDEARGRTSPDDVTLFKSVGTALEDLAAAEMVVEGPGASPSTG